MARDPYHPSPGTRDWQLAKFYMVEYRIRGWLAGAAAGFWHASLAEECKHGRHVSSGDYGWAEFQERQASSWPHACHSRTAPCPRRSSTDGLGRPKPAVRLRTRRGFGRRGPSGSDAHASHSPERHSSKVGRAVGFSLSMRVSRAMASLESNVLPKWTKSFTRLLAWTYL